MTNQDNPDQVKVEQLLPCPFCGGEAMAYDAVDLRDKFVHWTTIKCEQCGVEHSEEYTSEAIAAWNRRASLTPPVADSTGMREALKAHHEWHLAQEPDGLGVGGAEAYCDSGLFDQTVAALANQSDARRGEVMGAACYDCGRPYGDEHGFPDLVVPHDIWNEAISPTHDEGGLLCPSCLCQRAHDAAVRCEARFTSGPFKSGSTGERDD